MPIAYESVPLFAAVSGYLKTLKVDIGSHVHAGDVLAEIDVPELVQQLARNRAAVDQAKAKVAQMRAHKKVAEAEVSASKASVKQAEAAAKSAKAWLRFREKMLITHHGLSGPAILQISSYWKRPDPIIIDLLPDRDLTKEIKRHDLNSMLICKVEITVRVHLSSQPYLQGMTFIN